MVRRIVDLGVPPLEVVKAGTFKPLLCPDDGSESSKSYVMSKNIFQHEVQIEENGVVLRGDLTIPERAASIIVFAHGSGSSRHSSANKYVAERLNRSGFATLLLDLLTEQEEEEERHTMHHRFDVEMLSSRLCAAIDWLSFSAETANLNIGLFGASTGSAAALMCAAKRRLKVAAVVSRGGRPDLAQEALPYVLCPTLFLVGGFDPYVMAMNEKALRAMSCHREIEMIPGAGHLFEEPGKLEQVATLSAWWFVRYATLECNHGSKADGKAQSISSSLLEPLKQSQQISQLDVYRK